MDLTSPLTLEALTTQAAELARQSNPAEVETHIEAERARFRKQFTFENAYVGNEAAEARFVDDLRVKHDNALGANLKLWDLSYESQLAELDQQLAASQAPPQERDPVLHELRVLNLREQFRGRRLADVVAFYRSIDDASNPTATRAIETSQDLWALVPDKATDVQAGMELADLIRERRTARESTALREQRAKLVSLRTSSRVLKK